MNLKKDDDYILKWAKKIRAIEILGGKCVECGNDDIRCIDFHHLHDKSFSINRKINYRWSVIESEIKKCNLMCRTCHGEHHCVGATRLVNMKKKFVEIYGECKCKKCGYVSDNLGAYDFHHRDAESKDFEMGNAFRFVSDERYIEKIAEEIAKCDLLCRNCHSIVHFDMERFEKFKEEILYRSKNHKEQRPNMDVNVIMDMLKSGKKQIEIVRHFGCAKSTICELIKRNNLGA